MNATITPEIKEVIDAAHYRPAISIIVPFEPKMGLKSEISYRLKVIVDKVERQLKDSYPDDITALVIKKLQAIIKSLNFDTHKKSVAIYVSPVFEKVLYLDIAVEEKIIIDESFEIRDLIYSKKQLHKYLLLLLNEKEVRMYLGNTETFVRIISNAPESVYNYVNDIPERVANFSDMEQRRETIMDKFLHHIDSSLDIILNAYQLPLFIVGPERMLGHFKSMTKHKNAVIEYIEGNYDEATLHELKSILAPHVANWQKLKQKDILNQLEEAMSARKLAVAMQDVWYESMHNKGKLLVVEKNFMYPAEHSNRTDVIYNASEPYNKFSYIRDAVDDVIEKVLENGGDVEFVDEGMLDKYDHIALIQYY